jgi:hypothetical protein
MMRRSIFLAGVLGLLFLLAGCGAARPAPEEVRGTVRFKGEPEDAELTVNEIRLGPIGMFKERGVLLRPGKQRIEVSKDGYFTQYRLVAVEAGKLVEVEVRLREIP